MTGPSEPGRFLSGVPAVALLALCVLGPALASCSAEGDGAAGRREVPYWDERATPATVSERMGVTVPAGAADRRAAHQHGFQDDGLLLAFTLPTAEVDAFVRRLRPERDLRTREEPRRDPVAPATPFARLGLPEPDTLPRVLEGQVCAPCDGDLNALRVAVHQLGGDSSRVYLSAID
ncbi:hypothetical protein ACLGI4_16200 [Streptomyces sp. HMX112]|uniref:hypothetical protein n=1 Tax=Streptomyces sp. HMX112 TaxID=3390850 RepID=UPI003A8049A7